MARKNGGRAAISRKISKIRREDKPGKQAVAIALNMAREGDLGSAARAAAPRRKRRKK